MNSAIKAVYGALFAVSVAFFVVALLLNLASLGGFIPPGSISDKEVMFPIIGLMIVAVMTSLRLGKDLPRRDHWKVIWSFSAAWVRKFQYGFTGYVFATWGFLAWKQYESASAHVDPTPFLAAIAMVLSIASGMTAYAVFRDPTLLTGRTCKNGHRISPLDKYCPQCGVLTS